MKKRGIRIMVVATSRTWNPEEVNGIASSPASDNVFSFNKFLDPTTADEIVDELVGQICQEGENV